MKVTRKKLIMWGLIAYLSAIIGPPGLACALLVVDAFHITQEEKLEAQDEGPYRPEKVISRKLVGAVSASIGLFFMIGCPASVGFGLYLAIVALTTEPEKTFPQARGARYTRRPTASRVLIEPPLIIDEPPTPPPPPPRGRN
jgi:hypothetical protein